MRGLMVIVLPALVAALAQGAEEKPYIFVQAHRGFSAEYPELTLLAFEKAVEVGADRIEMDLSITEDGHAVLMHDTTVDRTTDGSGRVESFTLNELKELDAGSWMAPEFAGERVPSLSEVIELVQGRATLNLEVKSLDRRWSWVERVVEETVRTVHEHGAQDWVIYSSFDLRALLEVREHDPEARLMIIDWAGPGRFDGLTIAIEQDLFAWTPSAEYATEERIRRGAGADLSIHVGTSPGGRLHDWIEWGVNGFSSGNPRALIDWLERHGYR